METSSTASKPGDEQLIIVLRIEEGVSLNAAEAILMQASLGGNKLEAEPIKPGHTTLIDCNLVWETDRKTIKRMKTENLPVKIDCYSLRNFKKAVDGATKEHVGYILVPVKNIPIVALPKALQMKPRWMKLIGLSKEWRQHKPELLMNLMITTKDFLTCDKSEVLESHGLDVEDSIVIEENPIPCMVTSQSGIFIRLLKDDGLLQVGNIDTDCDVFTVKILIKNIRYLENMKLLEDDCDFFINYVLLGNQHTRALERKFNRIHQIQEKVSFNFRSSLSALQEYFEKVFFIPFEIVSGDKVCGASEIRLNDLITTTNLVEFLEKNPTSVHEMTGMCSIKPSQELRNNTNRPILEYKVKIHYLATRKLHQTECFENYRRNQDIDARAGGDYYESQRDEQPITSPTMESRKQLSDIPEGQSESETSNVMKAIVGVSKSTATATKQRQVHTFLAPKPSMTQSEKADIESILNTNQVGQASELPRLFSYNLHLSSIQFNRKPEKGIWQLSFYNDKADTPRSFVNKDINYNEISDDNTIVFDELELKLYFTSHTSSIMDLIKSSESCTLCVKGPRGTHAKAQLDCKSLLIGNKEKTSGIILLKDPSNQVTASANIFVYLDDLGINFNAQLRKSSPSQFIEEIADIRRSEMNITRTIEEQKMLLLDESFTYKMIEELEEWKEKQQETFFADLKQKESQYIERLKSDWIEKQAKYEQDLVMKADKLTNLTKTLQDVHTNLKQKGNQQSKNELEVQSYKEGLEKSFNSQLLVIRERARRMEEDLVHEIKLKDIRFDDIERCNQHLKKDNCELLQQVECLQAELKQLKSNLVPKAEVEMLLHEMRLIKEKCETTEQSKLFYKEQWAKACRECHKVRRQNISMHKSDIFTEKCDRICDALDDDHYELNIDKEELDEIKRCLNLSDDDV